jgi:hypothetical protein
MDSVAYRVDRYPCKSAPATAQTVFYTDPPYRTGRTTTILADDAAQGPQAAPQSPQLPRPSY